VNRKILFDPLLGMHSAFWEIVNYPPEGYEFVLSNTTWDRVFDRFVSRNELINANFALVGFLNKLFPLRLAKAWLDKLLKSTLSRKDIDLIFSMDHPIFGKKPWVIFITWPTFLTGMNTSHVMKYRGFIEQHLTSEYCKKIMTWSELCRTAILANFDDRHFADKIAVIPLAMHRQNFVKSHSADKVKLLFVGSANNPHGRVAAMLGTKFFFDFYSKGGGEALHAFRILNQRYSNLELIMRTGVPSAVKKAFENFPNIRFIDNVIPREDLEAEFRSADIFVFPTHQLTPWTAFLEAMSYELPIVTTNVYTNPEIVQDGVTGLLIQPSKTVPYYWKNLLTPMGSPRHREYMEAIGTPDPAVVDDLVAKTSLLIENPNLRKELGRRARREVEEGKHSIARRNQAFKQIFDAALESG